MKTKDIAKLKKIANQCRKDIIEMLYHSGSGHPGGSLSSADIITALYFSVLNHNPKKPKWEKRDRFVMSKGHGCPALYSALARSGYFPVKELRTLRKIGSRLQGHPDMLKLNCLEASTGSLGQGLSIAAGMALAAKMDREKYKVYCMMGDGEQQEGNIWEAAMFASHYRLDNLVGIVDYNKYQIDGAVHKVMNLEPLALKYESFGWNVIVIDGNDMKEIIKAFENVNKIKGKPTVIIANTIKGKGVVFMEGKAEWHGKAPNKKEYEIAMMELENGDIN